MDISAILVGDELLDGRVADANLRALGAFSAMRGGRVASARFVRDDVVTIADALNAADADTVVCSGGLGPTSDDLTRHAAARWADVELVENSETLQRIKDRFARHNRSFTDNNARQALFPAGATIHHTGVGTAAGFSLQVDGCRAYFFPGVPREFAWFLDHIIADLLPGGDGDERVRTMHFHGLGESSLESRIGPLTGVSVGFRADYPVIELKLNGEPAAVERAADKARAAVGEYLVATDTTLPERLGALLRQRGETVTTAESCTAGKLAAALTDTSGSSAWFRRGYVTYSNDAKVELVGVSRATLERYGAVSPQVAAQMALGAREASGDDWAIAVSGIAGPTGGSVEKPVGTVDFALAGPDGVWVRRFYYGPWSREFIRAGTVYTALQLLLWRLEGTIGERPVAGPFSARDVRRDEGIDHQAPESPR